MQLSGSTNKLPIILNAVENKFDKSDLFTNGENHRGNHHSQESTIINHKQLQV